MFALSATFALFSPVVATVVVMLRVRVVIARLVVIIQVRAAGAMLAFRANGLK